MAYAYQKLIEDKKIDQNKLPEIVQTAISEIAKTEKGLNVLKKGKEKKGEEFSISASITKKIKMLDSFAVRGIQDFLIDNEIEEELEMSSEEILKQAEEENKVKQQAEDKKKQEEEEAAKKLAEAGTTATTVAATNEPVAPDQDALAIEAELAQMYKDGKTVVTLQELKPLAPKAYKLIFEGYEVDGENGIKTSHYSLLETEKEKFTLKII